MKRFLPTVVKLLLAVAVFAWMGWQAAKSNSLGALLSNDKDWLALGLAVVVLAMAIALQSIRWRTLANALGLHMALGETLKIAYVAHLGSQFMAGMVVGDGIRIASLVRRNPGRLHDALIATFLDRAIGLLGLVLVAAAASFAFDLSSLRNKVETAPLEALLALAWGSRFGAVIGVVACGALFAPGVVEWKLWGWFKRSPFVGKFVANLLEAVKEYRDRPVAVMSAVALTFAIHGLFSLSLHLAASALPCEAPKPSLAANMTVAMLTLWINALPIGAFDIAFDVLYRGVADPATPHQHGFVIVLAWRLIQYAVATIGAVLLVTSRETVPAIAPEAVEQPTVGPS